MKTREDVETLAAAGFTFFTIDPSAHVDNHADSLVGGDLEAAAHNAVKGASFESVCEVESLYLGKTFDLGNGVTVAVKDRASLLRATGP